MLRKKIVNPFSPLVREHIKEIYTFYEEYPKIYVSSNEPTKLKPPNR
jgi:hypothetical protein